MSLPASISRLMAWTLALPVAGLLAACGGGSSAGPSTTTSTRLQPGFFATAIASPASYPDTVAWLTADQTWWAVRRDSATSVALFQGSLSQDGQGGGAVSSLKAYVAARLRSGTVAMTAVSEQGAAARISIQAETGAAAQIWDAALNKPAASAYAATDTPDVARLDGSWTGTWVDGVNTATTTEQLNAGVLSLSAPVMNCELGTGSQVMALAGVNLYKVDLSFLPGRVTCARSDQLDPRLLSGVLAVYQLPDGRRRLDLVATEASGSGIVFRAER